MLDNITRSARSWAVKIIFGIIILVFIFWGVGNFSAMPKHTAAEVNGESIAMTAVMREAEANIDNFRRSVPDFASDKDAQTRFKQAVLRELVQRTLRRQEAERLGLFVSHAEVSAVVASIGLFKDEQGKFDNNRYKAFLKQRGWNQGQFQEDTRISLLDEKLMALVTAGVGLTEAEAKASFDLGLTQHTAQYVLFSGADHLDQVQVSDQEITAWYETNKDTLRLPERIDVDYIELTPALLTARMTVSDAEIAKFYEDNQLEYSEPSGYSSRQILLRLPKPEDAGYQEALGKAQARMGEIQQKLASGSAFTDLAREYSEDPMTRALGGEMGFINEGLLPEAIDKAALGLKPGEVGAPVQTPFGLHLIMLEDKRAARQKPLAEVRDKIQEKLALEKAQAAFPEFQAKAEEALRLGTAFDKIAAELGSPLKHSGLKPRSEVVALLKLHKDSVSALAGVPTGRAAPSPLAVSDGIVLVFVKDAKPEEIPTLDTVKNDITATLKRNRAEALAGEAARKALPEFTGTSDVPAAYKSKVKESQKYSVAGPFVRPLTRSEALGEALMAAPANTWLPQVYNVEEGTVIARQISSTPPAADEWAQLKEMFMKNQLQRKREDVAMAFMQNLLEKAEISIHPEALDQISLR